MRAHTCTRVMDIIYLFQQIGQFPSTTVPGEMSGFVWEITLDSNTAFSVQNITEDQHLGRHETGWGGGKVMHLAGGSEIRYLHSYSPGFSDASATFSWTSLGMTMIDRTKPKQPVNAGLLGVQLNSSGVNRVLHMGSGWCAHHNS